MIPPPGNADFAAAMEKVLDVYRRPYDAAFPPAEAKILWDRFDFVYTPKHGSWLNVAEVELNVMTRQCLNRRIDSLKILRDEVAAWQASRDRIQAKVNWQFTTDDARVKLKRLYPTLDEWQDTS